MTLLKTAIWYNGYGYLLNPYALIRCILWVNCQFWCKQKHWKMLTCCIISLTNLHWQLLDKGFYVPTQISYLTLIITQNYFWPDSDMTWYVYAYTCTQLLCIVWRTKHDFYDLKKKLSCKEKKCAHHKNCIVPN